MKTCRVCGISKELSEFRVMRAKGRPNWRQGKCRDCDNSYQRIRVQTFYRDKHKAICKVYKSRLRRELLKAYGSKCDCCGETTEEFLELDHVDGGGNQHRKRVKKDLYKVVKDENYPNIYRLLCANCNHSLGMRGYCPHKSNGTIL